MPVTKNRTQNESTLAKKAIMQTLLYSSLFHFPLTKSELWEFLKSDKPVTTDAFNSVMKQLPRDIAHIDRYYFLKGQEQIVAERKRRLVVSQEKIILAKSHINKLSFLPTVLFIGISGSLAMTNARKADDIDLFIIVKKNTIWLSRLLLLLILSLFGLRRSKQSSHTANKICLNMLLDEQALLLPQDRHDVYTAHEIAQVYPLFERHQTYQRFLSANAWVKTYMPNVTSTTGITKYAISEKTGRQSSFIKFIEKVAGFIQLLYINRTITTETVNDRLLAFHPMDNRKKILKKYRELLSQYFKS